METYATVLMVLLSLLLAAEIAVISALIFGKNRTADAIKNFLMANKILFWLTWLNILGFFILNGSSAWDKLPPVKASLFINLIFMAVIGYFLANIKTIAMADKYLAGKKAKVCEGSIYGHEYGKIILDGVKFKFRGKGCCWSEKVKIISFNPSGYAVVARA